MPEAEITTPEKKEIRKTETLRESKEETKPPPPEIEIESSSVAKTNICPHRFAQLSRGVITPQKKLKCGYHGIEYNEVGKATLIPHSKKNKCDGIQANKFETATNFELTWVNIDPQ